MLLLREVRVAQLFCVLFNILALKECVVRNAMLNTFFEFLLTMYIASAAHLVKRGIRKTF